jgi:hypothetical protein
MMHSPFSAPSNTHNRLRSVNVPVPNGIDDARQPFASVHTTLVAVDITGFGTRHDSNTQRYLRAKMYEHLIEAFAMTRLSWWDCYREDRGDGILIIAPPDISGDLFLDPLAHHLTAVLRRDNRLANCATRLELRAAVHHGDVHPDPYGITGDDVNYLCRLLDAAAFKKALNTARSGFAMIVSDRLYTDAAKRGGVIDTAAYRQLRITNKEIRCARTWLWLPPTPC